MAIRVQDFGDVCVLTIEDELQGEAVEELRSQLQEAIDQRQVVDLAVDLENCPFIDSEGLEALLHGKRRCEDMFGSLKLVRPDENVSKILQITRLVQRFDISDDLAQAVKGMR